MIGFPVLLKASAGGGGKGMRIVRSEASLSEEIEMVSLLMTCLSYKIAYG
jgi:biotin carboxylase